MAPASRKPSSPPAGENPAQTTREKQARDIRTPDVLPPEPAARGKRAGRSSASSAGKEKSPGAKGGRARGADGETVSPRAGGRAAKKEKETPRAVTAEVLAPDEPDLEEEDSADGDVLDMAVFAGEDGLEEADLSAEDFSGRDFGRDDADRDSLDGCYDARTDRYLGLPARDSDSENLPVPARSRLPVLRDGFQAFVQKLNRYPLLRPEEEHDLAVRWRDFNDIDARNRILAAHLRLVVKIALEFQRKWMQNVMDLVQEGNNGLLHAVRKFNPDKGIKFSYYSAFWIKAYILKFIMDNFRMVKIGTTQVQRRLFYNLNKERQKLTAQGFVPDPEMLARELGVSKSDVIEMEQRLSSTDVSLNAPRGDDKDSPAQIDFLPALGPGIEESLASREVSDMVAEKIRLIRPRLSEKELFILDNRLYCTGDKMTLREIGERYHITRERVRQLELRLHDKLRKFLAGEISDFSESWIQS